MPANPTPNAAIPYPAGGDAPSGPAGFNAMATRLDVITVPGFATGGLRDAAIPAPVTGQNCTVAGQPMVYQSGAWRKSLTDVNQWQNLTNATNTGQTVQAQARLSPDGQWVELRGMMRHTSYFPAGLILLTSGGAGAALISQVATAYATANVGGPTMTTSGGTLDGNNNFLPACLMGVQARSDGALRVAAQTAGVATYVSLVGLRMPTA